MLRRIFCSYHCFWHFSNDLAMWQQQLALLCPSHLKKSITAIAQDSRAEHHRNRAKGAAHFAYKSSPMCLQVAIDTRIEASRPRQRHTAGAASSMALYHLSEYINNHNYLNCSSENPRKIVEQLFQPKSMPVTRSFRAGDITA